MVEVAAPAGPALTAALAPTASPARAGELVGGWMGGWEKGYVLDAAYTQPSLKALKPSPTRVQNSRSARRRGQIAGLAIASNFQPLLFPPWKSATIFPGKLCRPERGRERRRHRHRRLGNSQRRHRFRRHRLHEHGLRRHRLHKHGLRRCRRHGQSDSDGD